MNRSIRNLAVALPLAVAALSATAGTASASDNGPVIVQPNGGGDPKPMDIAIPKPKPADPQGPADLAIPKPKPTQPKGPGDIKDAPKPTHPDGPGDIKDAPKPTHPDGPGDITNPAPCPTHGVDCTPGDGGQGGDEPGTSDEPSADNGSVGSISVPSRIDAGQPSDGTAGLELTWLIAGGALVTASGAAYAARSRARRQS
ncbi:MAG: hypothetical protein ACJ72D_08600 [Marmoricola sp.]